MHVTLNSSLRHYVLIDFNSAFTLSIFHLKEAGFSSERSSTRSNAIQFLNNTLKKFGNARYVCVLCLFQSKTKTFSMHSRNIAQKYIESFVSKEFFFFRDGLR